MSLSNTVNTRKTAGSITICKYNILFFREIHYVCIYNYLNVIFTIFLSDCYIRNHLCSIKTLYMMCTFQSINYPP